MIVESDSDDDFNGLISDALDLPQQEAFTEMPPGEAEVMLEMPLRRDSDEQHPNPHTESLLALPEQRPVSELDIVIGDLFSSINTRTQHLK